MTTLVLVHVGASLKSAYEIALGERDARVVQVSAGGLSAAYDDRSGLAAQYPTLQAFLNSAAPGWDPAAPVVLVAFSAGVWAARAWMRDPGSRALTSALVVLDGAHGGLTADGACNLEALQGLVEYGRLCAAEPERHLLVVTHTSIDPVIYASTTSCARGMRGQLPSSSSIEFIGTGGTAAEDHNAQQRTVGPQVLRDIVGPWLRGERRPVQLKRILGAALAFAGVLGALWWWHE